MKQSVNWGACRTCSYFTSGLDQDKWAPPGRLIIWCPLKPILFKTFRSRTGLANLFGAHVQTGRNFRRKYFYYGKLSLLSLYFR